MAPKVQPAAAVFDYNRQKIQMANSNPPATQAGSDSARHYGFGGRGKKNWDSNSVAFKSAFQMPRRLRI